MRGARGVLTGEVLRSPRNRLNKGRFLQFETVGVIFEGSHVNMGLVSTDCSFRPPSGAPQ
jgi:hypothetical protein